MLEEYNHFAATFTECVYTDRLLKKLEILNKKVELKADLDEVRKAIFYARKFHGKQKRLTGEAYYSHPIEVAYMISDYLLRTDILVTAILHDTIEDTEATEEMIAEIFDRQIASQVMDLTRDKDGYKITSAQMVDLLWQEKKYDMLLIKQFDRLHNTQTLHSKSPEKIRKMVEETMISFVTLAMKFEIPALKQELINNCLKALSIEQNPSENFKLNY